MNSEVTTQLLLLFLLMCIGIAAKKTGLLNKNGADMLSSFISNVTMPCMYVATFMQLFSVERMRQGFVQLGFSAVYYIIVFILGIIFIKMTRAPEKDEGVYRFLIIFSNAAFMGYPVLDAIFRENGGDPRFFGVFFNIPFNLLAFTLGVYLLTKNNGADKTKRGFKTYVNPATVSIFVGLIFFFISPLFPKQVYDVVYDGFFKQGLALLGNTTIPLSMVVIGTVLAGINPKNIFGNPRIFGIAALRLAIIPAALFFIIRLFGLPHIETGVPVVIAGMPCAVFCVILSKQYGGNEELASVGVFITTLLSFISIPALIWLIG